MPAQYNSDTSLLASIRTAGPSGSTPFLPAAAAALLVGCSQAFNDNP